MEGRNSVFQPSLAPDSLMASQHYQQPVQIATARRQRLTYQKDLREHNLNKFATRFGSDLDGTIEEKPRHSIAMLRFFRLRRVQRWPEDWIRNVQVMFSQVQDGKRANSTQYRNAFPIPIKSNAPSQDIRSHPAATHNGSPSTGTQDNSRIGLPHFRTCSTARRCAALDNSVSGYRKAMSQPSPHELIPPNVLPAVATANKFQEGRSLCVANATNATSELPGKIVEERKALKNRPNSE